MYGIYIRIGFLIALSLIISFFLTIPYAEPEPYRLKSHTVGLINEITSIIDKEVESIDNTERPKPPVATPGNNTGDDVTTIPSTDLLQNIIPVNPIGPEIEIVPYYKVEVKPKPVYLARPDYPDLPRKAGIEGKVVLKMLVDVDGRISKVEIIKSSGNALLDESAITAAKRCIFTPARQRDSSVRVWIVWQVEFKIKG
jgi:protein TonB